MKRTPPGTSEAIANKATAIEALELRKAGATYEAIAQQLGYSNRNSAHRAVQTLLRRRTTENVDELRVLENERLDDLLRAVYDVALAGGDKAIDKVLRIMERRARMWGLDAPTQTHVTGDKEIIVRFADSDLAEADGAASVDSE
jgi:transcriptional regulator